MAIFISTNLSFHQYFFSFLQGLKVEIIKAKDLTEEQKAEAQSRDSVLSHLHKLKNEHGEKPTWSEVAIENVQLK